MLLMFLRLNIRYDEGDEGGEDDDSARDDGGGRVSLCFFNFFCRHYCHMFSPCYPCNFTQSTQNGDDEDDSEGDDNERGIDNGADEGGGQVSICLSILRCHFFHRLLTYYASLIFE